MAYDYTSIESKWQERWEKNNPFAIDLNKSKKPFYGLTMFPYPSGDRLHMGHWYVYGLMDSWLRFMKMKGHDVFAPMGFDAFGLPAENFAIKEGVHPDISTTKNVEYMINQFKKMGVSYNWEHSLDTSKPDYYRWTQWLFLQLYKNGLAYKKEAPVNWCPSCQTVLANEQVAGGTCDRCGTVPTKKKLNQWFFKTTDYAEKLLQGIDSLNWPHKTKTMQQHWIGRSEGTEIDFQIESSGKKFTVFTTRPDTLYGATYVTFAPEHPVVSEITTKEQQKQVETYIEKTKQMSEVDRQAENREKTGVFTGSYAINPANQQKIPIWIGDYVLYSYGTGVVMAVPAHDQRDFEFAQAHKLPVQKVILEPNTNHDTKLEQAYEDHGNVINSGPYNDMNSQDMIIAITKDLEKKKLGKATITYRLRDWLVSRQRYWGCPIPIVYCPDCGELPISEDQLPVKLPKDVDFKVRGESPLKYCESFIHTKCPQCGNNDTLREIDTLDTFTCSSWYFLRFPSVGNDKEPFNKELTDRVMPVDRYVGGPEHACMHLIYARFITMVLHDLGFVNFKEPFPNLTHQGLVLGADSQKMSKSKGNSVSPDQYVERKGSDALRMYLAFGYNYIEGGPWNEDGFKATTRFIDRVWNLFSQHEDLIKTCHEDTFNEKESFSAEEKKLLYVLHNSIKMITVDTERFMFNTSIARLMELHNALQDYKQEVDSSQHNKALLQYTLKNFIILLAPYAPHMADEWWEKTGKTTSVFLTPWPQYDPSFLQMDEITMAVMINGKRRDEISVSKEAKEDEVLNTALSLEKIKRHIGDKKIVKQIIVPQKLINLIVK